MDSFLKVKDFGEVGEDPGEKTTLTRSRRGLCVGGYPAALEVGPVERRRRNKKSIGKGRLSRSLVFCVCSFLWDDGSSLYLRRTITETLAFGSGKESGNQNDTGRDGCKLYAYPSRVRSRYPT